MAPFHAGQVRTRLQAVEMGMGKGTQQEESTYINPPCDEPARATTRLAATRHISEDGRRSILFVALHHDVSHCVRRHGRFLTSEVFRSRHVGVRQDRAAHGGR